jgi:hypothetical protein
LSVFIDFNIIAALTQLFFGTARPASNKSSWIYKRYAGWYDVREIFLRMTKYSGGVDAAVEYLFDGLALAVAAINRGMPW